MNRFLSKDMISEFIPNSDLRKLYISSQIVRTILGKITSFYAASYINLYQKIKKNSKDVKIGIIGLGHVGSTILEELLRINLIPPSNILVSTRCPERHQEHSENGVKVFWDNEKLATESDFIILSCLPHQVETICTNIRTPLLNKHKKIFNYTEEDFMPSTLIFSIISGTPKQKLVQMADNYPFIIRCALDVDMINITIDQTSEEDMPINNCIELLNEIVFRSVDFDDALQTFNMVFTGANSLCEEIQDYFKPEQENKSERIKELLYLTNIIKHSV